MREIKFRVPMNCHIKGFYFKYYNSLQVIFGDNSQGYLEEPDFSKAQQYTGLKDKNGVEIYEGDIIEQRQARGGDPIRGVMEMSYAALYDDGWRFAGRIIDDLHSNIIIGNIYENPELLEGL